ncbi:hypothetical protein GKODMF_08390 [Candidatus Electrothrix gigas]
MASTHTPWYSLDTVIRWIDLSLLILFFLICTGKNASVFPNSASIQLWKVGILWLIVSFWRGIFSFMHTERSITLYETWKDIIIRNCVATALGWGVTLFCIFFVNLTANLSFFSEEGRELLYVKSIENTFVWLGFLLLLFLPYRVITALLLKKKYIQQPLSNALIVGLNVRSLALAENLRRKGSGYNLLGFVDTLPEEDALLYADALDLVCSLEEMEEYVTTHRVDEIFLTLPVRSFYDEMKHIIQYGTSMGLTIRVLNDLFTFEKGGFDYIDGDLTYFVADSPLPNDDGLQLDIKYLVDKIIAFFALLFLLPFFIAVWILNFLHWPFVLKEYIGINKKMFRMVQFKDRQAVACLQKKGLRNIPGLINILTGNMSIIGPKPVSVQDIGAYETFDQRRFAVRPGFLFIISDHPRQENSISHPGRRYSA